MKLVIIESPYKGDLERNSLYLKDALKDSLLRGEAPFASHFIYAAVLDDTNPRERSIGILTGWAWMARADIVAVYSDYGISGGMAEGINNARLLGKTIEYRYIYALGNTGMELDIPCQ